MRLKALLLDFDGTIADSLGLLRTVYDRFVREVGGRPSTAEFNSLNGPPLAEVVERLCIAHGIPGSIESRLSRYHALIDDEFGNVRPSQGLEELVTAAEDLGLQAAIVTSNRKERVDAWLRSRSLAARLELLVCGDEIDVGKPDPAPYLLALHKLHRTPSEAVAIEDSDSGAASSIAAGIFTLKLGTAGAGMGNPLLRSIANLSEGAALLRGLDGRGV